MANSTQKITNKERQRQQRERYKRKRQKIMLQRILIISAGVLVVVICVNLVGGIIKWVQGDQANKLAQTSSNEASVHTSKDVEAPPLQETDTEVIALTTEDLQKGDLILVNEDYPIRKYSDKQCITLVDHNEGLYKIKDEQTKLAPQVVQALNKLVSDFNAAVGENDLGVISGYRSYDTQERLHYKAITEKKSEDTDILVARPDRSEHHTGLAVDFGLYYSDGMSADYDGKGIYEWITKNCSQYGFVVRYTDEKKYKTGIGDEPWHLRYVGEPHSEIMTELNLCLEEYLEYIKVYRYYTNPLQENRGPGSNYSIYYVPTTGELTKVPVPKAKAYTISGNNQDGYIVTVRLN